MFYPLIAPYNAIRLLQVCAYRVCQHTGCKTLKTTIIFLCVMLLNESQSQWGTNDKNGNYTFLRECDFSL